MCRHCMEYDTEFVCVDMKKVRGVKVLIYRYLCEKCKQLEFSLYDAKELFSQLRRVGWPKQVK